MPRKGRHLDFLALARNVRDNINYSLRREEDKVIALQERKKKWMRLQHQEGTFPDEQLRKDFERHLRLNRKAARENIGKWIDERIKADADVESARAARKRFPIGFRRRIGAGMRANYRLWRIRKSKKRMKK